MAVTIEKRDFPKIKLTKDGKVLYNGIDLSEHCSGINADIRPHGTEVTLTFSDVIFEAESNE
ncbi:MAG: hypothetical protein E7478_09250 [Ruminococcaceae bacterium]|nr:hypothetical protein [Oscillospiraceae bacterium]